MRNLVLFFGLAILLVVSSCDSTNTEATMQDELSLKAAQKVLNFRAHLTGDQEVPPTVTEASGTAIFQLSKNGEELSYKLIVDELEDVHMAHLHLAPAGTNGGVVVWLYPSAPPAMMIPGITSGILAQGVITSSSLRGALAGKPLSALVDAIFAGNIYVNAHTMKYPGGEIRGQVSGNLPASVN